MDRHEKLLERFRRRPRDFTWEELTTLLRRLGLGSHYHRSCYGKFSITFPMIVGPQVLIQYTITPWD
jgi:hypothetical protein